MTTLESRRVAITGKLSAMTRDAAEADKAAAQAAEQEALAKAAAAESSDGAPEGGDEK